jgi:hypothetical protein
MLLARVAQARPSRPPAAQGLGNKGPLAPPSDQTADLEAPVGIEMITPPVVAPHIWQLVDYRGQMGGQSSPGAPLADMPPDGPRWPHKRGDHSPYPMTAVLVLAFLRFPRGHGLWGVWALQNLPAGLCSGAHDHTPLGKEA